MCCVGMGPMTLVVLASSFLPVQLQCSIFLSLSRSVALCKWGIRHEALFSTSPSHGSAPCLTETASHRALPVEGTPPPHTHTHIHTPLALPNHGNYKTSAASSPLSLDSSNQPLLRALTKPPPDPSAGPLLRRPQTVNEDPATSLPWRSQSDCEWRANTPLPWRRHSDCESRANHILAMEDPIRLCMKSQPHPCHGGPIQTVHEEPTTSLPWRTHSPCPQTLRHTGFFAFYPALTTPWWGLGTPVMLFFPNFHNLYCIWRAEICCFMADNGLSHKAC